MIAGCEWSVSRLKGERTGERLMMVDGWMGRRSSHLLFTCRLLQTLSSCKKSFFDFVSLDSHARNQKTSPTRELLRVERWCMSLIARSRFHSKGRNLLCVAQCCGQKVTQHGGKHTNTHFTLHTRFHVALGQRALIHWKRRKREAEFSVPRWSRRERRWESRSAGQGRRRSGT